jgi:AraC-like DNA-binding protein
LEAARVMLEDSSHPVEVVAVESGFVDTERMRRAFVRAFGHPPQAIRRNARDDSNGEGSPEHQAFPILPEATSGVAMGLRRTRKQ